MSTQTYSAPAQSTMNGSTPDVPERVGPSRRRSPAMVSLGVVLVIVGALVGWRYVASSASNERSYLAVLQPVPMGSRITADDLQTVTITTARGLTPVPATEMSRVVGEYAAVPLVPGTLLTDQQLVASNAVAANQALLGIDLSPMQRPNRPLAAGEKVLLIAVPPPSGSTASDSSSTSQSQPTLPTMTATVVGVGDPDNDSNIVVDVVVPKDSANVVAWYADQNRVAVVLVSGS